MPKVIVGMSGGVDSSVAAYLLREKGYEVEGLSFILWEKRRKADFKTCCSIQAVEEAAKTAQYIGIPHLIADVKDDFVEKVIEPFVNAYAEGSTPNPCILCNRFIKFAFCYSSLITKKGSGSKEGPILCPLYSESGAT